MDKLLISGSLTQNYGFNFNGLYQELAYLYAASGNSAKVLQCIDTLLAYSQNNFQGDYGAGADNATNIASVYFLNETTSQLDEFVNGYCARKKISGEEFYARLIGRTLHANFTTSNLRLYPFMDENLNLNLPLTGRKQLSFFFNKYRSVVDSSVKDTDGKTFYMALSFKNEAILKSINREQPDPGEPSIAALFDKAISLYQATNPQWREQAISVLDVSGADQTSKPRKYLFLYPDFRTPFHPQEPRAFFYFYFSDAFVDYLVSNHLLNSLYGGQPELNYMSEWLTSVNVQNISPSVFMSKKPRYEVLKKLDQELQNSPVKSGVDFNLLYLYLGLYAQRAGNLEEMVGYYDKIERAGIFTQLRSKEYAGNPTNLAFQLIANAVAGYTKASQPDKAGKLAALFKNPVNRSTLYAFAATEMLKEKVKSPLIQKLIDSSYKEMSRVENTTGNQPNRRLLSYALVMQDPKKNANEAYELIKNLPVKFPAISNITRSFAFYNDLYSAQARIPGNISGSDQADFFRFLLIGYSQGNRKENAAWNEYTQRYQRQINAFILYIDENS